MRKLLTQAAQRRRRLQLSGSEYWYDSAGLDLSFGQGQA